MVTKGKKTGGKPASTKLTDEKLVAVIKEQQKTVSGKSKSTLINKWDVGGALTAKQFAEIKGQVDMTEVKQYKKQVIVVDDAGKFAGYKDVDQFVNKAIVRINNAIAENKLADNQVASASVDESKNSKDWEGKNIGLHMERSKLSALKHEFHGREVVRKEKAMAAAGLAYENRQEIYKAAVQARNLTTEDMETVDTEVTAEVPAPEITA